MIPQLLWRPGVGTVVIAVAVAILAAFVVASYRKSIRHTGSLRARLLCAVRLIAIGLLVIASFRPSVVRELPISAFKQLIVILDNSKSMNAIDSSRTNGQLARFAALTGAFDPPADEVVSAPIGRIRNLIADMQSLKAVASENAAVSGQLAEIRTRVRAISSDTAVAGSLAWMRPALGEIERLLGSISTIDQAERAAAALLVESKKRREADDESLADTGQDASDAINSLRAATRFDLARSAVIEFLQLLGKSAGVELRDLQSTISLSDLATAKAESAETPLTRSLRQIVERRVSGVDAIVLFTDGRTTEPRANIPPALTAAGVPVYPVLMSSGQRQADVRILSVDVGGKALLGEKANVVVRIRSRDADGRTVIVRLSDGQASLTHSITLGPSDAVVRFDFPMTRAGAVTLEASIEEASGESLSDSRVMRAEIVVRDQQIRVLWICGDISPQADGVDQILRNSNWINYRRELIRSGKSLIAGVNELREQDVIFLANAPASAISGEQIDAISSLVGDGGKSLILLDLTPETLAAYAARPELQRLLSLAPGATFAPPRDEIIPIPTPPASNLPMLQLDSNGEPQSRIWNTKPPVKLIADLAAFARTSVPLLADRERRVPVMVEQFYRNGRVVIFGGAVTTGWPSIERERFWTLLIRHLVDTSPDARNTAMKVSIDRSRVIVGHPIEVRVVAKSTDSPHLALRRPDRSLETQNLIETLPGSGRWIARVTPRMAGACEIVAHVANQELILPVDVLADEDIETSDTSPDPAFLQRIAAATGGEFFTFDQIDELPELINRPGESRTRRIEQAIWCSPYYFAIIVALLGIEWSLRKSWGLV